MEPRHLDESEEKWRCLILDCRVKKQKGGIDLIKVEIEVEDWDTGETIAITLPCDLRGKIDLTHDLQIVDWEGNFSIDHFDNIRKLNDIIEDINAENPDVTLELLSAIYDACDTGGFGDDKFIQKICSNDFMLEEIISGDGWLMNRDEEICACYLATELLIPFARNITQGRLQEIKNGLISMIDWGIVWKYYTHMGFKLIKLNGRMFAFHWGDAER